MSIRRVLLYSALILIAGWLVFTRYNIPRLLQPCHFLSKIPGSDELAGMDHDKFRSWVVGRYGTDYILREDLNQPPPMGYAHATETYLANATTFWLSYDDVGDKVLLFAWLEPVYGPPRGYEITRCLGEPQSYEAYFQEEFADATLWYPEHGLRFSTGVNRQAVPSNEFEINIRRASYNVLIYHPVSAQSATDIRKTVFSITTPRELMEQVPEKYDPKPWTGWKDITAIYLE